MCVCVCVYAQKLAFSVVHLIRRAMKEEGATKKNTNDWSLHTYTHTHASFGANRTVCASEWLGRSKN